MATAARIRRHTDLIVYQKAFQSAKLIFDATKRFPREELYSLTDQVRRSSRSVCANLAEAWRKRRYQAAFISKLSDCEAEAAETQTWVIFARDFGYLKEEEADSLLAEYDEILRMLVAMIINSKKWILT